MENTIFLSLLANCGHHANKIVKSIIVEGERGGLVVEPRTAEQEVRFDTYLCRVVSLSKTHLLPNSTGNTQAKVAPSRHDWKIVYWDIKLQQAISIRWKANQTAY